MHHSDEYKLLAIELYEKYDSIRKVAEILNCSKSSIHRWIQRYYETGNIKKQ